MQEKIGPPVFSLCSIRGDGAHDYYREVERRGKGWLFKYGEIKKGKTEMLFIRDGAEMVTLLKNIEAIKSAAPLNYVAIPGVEGHGTGAQNKDDNALPAENDDWSEGARNTTLARQSFRAGILNDIGALRKVEDKAVASGPSKDEVKDTASRRFEAGREAFRTNKTLPEKSPQALLAVLENENYEVRFNELSVAMELRQMRPSGEGIVPDDLRVKRDWHAPDDLEKASIFGEISRTYSLATNKGPRPFKVGADLKDFMNELLHNRRVNPFKEWLMNTVPEWDGTEQLDRFLINFFGAEDTDISRWASRYPFLAVIQRTMDPGCKLDEMLMLKGPQASGSQHY